MTLTLEQWAADEGVQKRFHELIHDPVMQAAIALVRAQGRAQRRQADDPQHILTLYALDHSRQTGWHDALSALEALQKLTGKKQKNQPQPWKHKDTE